MKTCCTKIEGEKPDLNFNSSQCYFHEAIFELLELEQNTYGSGLKDFLVLTGDDLVTINMGKNSGNSDSQCMKEIKQGMQ